MKKIAAVTIGILLTLSSFAQLENVITETIITDEGAITYNPGEHDINFTGIDVNMKPSRMMAKITLYNSKFDTKIILKGKVIDVYVEEGRTDEQITFVVFNEKIGMMRVNSDKIFQPQSFQMNYNSDTKEYGTTLVFHP